MNRFGIKGKRFIFFSMPCSVCPSFALRCANLTQLHCLQGKNGSSAARHPKQHFPLLTSLVTFGPGFKNKILRFYLHFWNSSLAASFPSPPDGLRERSAGPGPEPSAWWERSCSAWGRLHRRACLHRCMAACTHWCVELQPGLGNGRCSLRQTPTSRLKNNSNSRNENKTENNRQE